MRMMRPVLRFVHRFAMVRFRLGRSFTMVRLGLRLAVVVMRGRLRRRMMVVVRRRRCVVMMMVVVIIPIPGNQGIKHQLAGGEEQSRGRGKCDC